MCGDKVLILAVMVAGILFSCPTKFIGIARAAKGGRIHGGQKADQNEFPSIARIKTADGGPHRCGASVIDREWVLTAAHCIVDDGEIITKESWEIRVGNHYGTRQLGEQRVGVVRQIVHERFNRTKGLAHVDDIALLQVSPPIRFGGKYVQPVNLQDCNTLEPGEAWAVGWGLTGGYGSEAEDLQKVKVRVVSKEECRRALQEAGLGEKWKLLPATVTCVIHEPGQGACQGDSGSPLYVWKDNKRKLEQIGVASAIGNGSNCENGFTFYTNPSYYRGWIRRRISGCGNFRSTNYQQKELMGYP